MMVKPVGFTFGTSDMVSGVAMIMSGGVETTCSSLCHYVDETIVLTRRVGRVTLSVV